jgi:hypothetical protein
MLPNWDAVMGHGKRIITLLGLCTVIIASGNRLLRLMAIATPNIFEEFAFSFALGYGAWGSALFLAGLAGFWSPNLLLALFVISCVLALPEGMALFRRVLPTAVDEAKCSTPSERILVCCFIVVYLANFRLTLAPETFYDALQYHLALPNLYLLNGRIFPTPENSYSGIPALPQMLYGWTLAVDRWGITASALHSSLIIWIAAALIASCRRMGQLSGGVIAASAFFFVPVVMGESFRTSVGLEWTLMQMCCFNALLASLESASGTPQRKAWLTLTGIFLGLAMSMKYPAWLIPAALLPAYFINPNQSNTNVNTALSSNLSVKELVRIVLIGALCLAPWVVKNIWFYHNPIYPFFHEYFARQSEYIPNWRQISSAGTDIHSMLSTLGGLSRYLTFPLRFLLPSEGTTYSIGLFSVSLTPILFMLELTGKEKLLAWFCLFLWIPLSILSPLTRFFIPHLALLTLLICSTTARIQPQRARTILAAITSLLCLITGFNWTISITSSSERLAVINRTTHYDEYLAHTRTSYPTPAYAGIRYINQETPPESRILLYGDSRSFYMQRRYLATSDDQIPALEVWANESASAEELKQRVDRAGIRYILMNLGEVARLHRQPQTSSRGISNLATFWIRHTQRVYGVKDYLDRWVGVYKVLDSSESTMAHTTDDLFSRYAQPAHSEKQ